MEGSRRVEDRPILHASESSRYGSEDLGEQETTLSEDSHESMYTEWTNEKHSMYLKSMEATFVNQLYSSRNSNSQKNEELSVMRSSRQTHHDPYSTTPSGQFKVLRGGNWKKINFERPGYRVNRVNQGNHGLGASPWIQHFRSGSRVHVLASQSIQDNASSGNQTMDSDGKPANVSGSASNSKQFHSCHTEHLCTNDSNTEVTDQNFADEEKAEVNACVSSTKIMTLEINTSNNDQVVP